MKQLRPYQIQAIDFLMKDLKDHGRGLLSLLPALGKTVIFSKISEMGHKHGRKILILLNQIQLLKQAYEELKTVIPKEDIGIFNGTLNIREIKQITVATIQSIPNEEFFEQFHLLVIDEVHLFNSFLKGKEDWKQKIVGVSATPYVTNEYLYGVDKFFPKISFELPYEDAVKQGYLVPLQIGKSTHQFKTEGLSLVNGDYRPMDLNALVFDEMDKIKLQVEDAIARTEERKKVLFVTTSIAHCDLVSEMVGGCTWHSKENRLDDFLQGKSKYLCTVLSAIAGFNFPELDTLVLMRPTRSPVLFKQVTGRILRVSPGKKDALLLDYGNAYLNLGHPLTCKPTIKGIFERMESEPKKEGKSGFTWEDSIKNLSLAPFEEDSESQWFTVTDMIKKEHKAKSGNMCAKITFFNKGLKIVDIYFTEQFLINYKGLDIPTFLDQYEQPREVLVGYENNFRKILSSR